MTDPLSNSHTDSGGWPLDKEKPGGPKEGVKRIVSEGNLEQVKPGVIRRFRETFLGDDAKSAVMFAMTNTAVPALKNLAFDMGSQFLQRGIFGDKAPPRRGGGFMGFSSGSNNKVQYHQVSERMGYRNSSTRPPMGLRPDGHISARRQDRDVIIHSKAEAEEVLDYISTCFDTYDNVSVADVNEMLGAPLSHTDNKWGWTSLEGMRVRQVAQGWLLDLPPAQPL